MAFLPALVPALTAIGAIAGIGTAAYSILKKPPALPGALPPVTQDVARQQVEANDALARRRGSLSDILTGTSGLEAGLGTTGKFVAGN